MDQFSRKNESAPFKLPEVQPDPQDVGQPYEAVSKNVNEHSIAKAIEQNSLSSSLSNAATQAAIPIKMDPKTITGQDDTAVSAPKQITVTDDLPANDTDLIEKAWVVKAKEIVEQTKNDPFEQSNEIKKIRADYQNKRFNTNVKIDSE